jgi:hypothetical protein
MKAYIDLHETILATDNVTLLEFKKLFARALAYVMPPVFFVNLLAFFGYQKVNEFLG